MMEVDHESNLDVTVLTDATQRVPESTLVPGTLVLYPQGVGGVLSTVKAVRHRDGVSLKEIVSIECERHDATAATYTREELATARPLVLVRINNPTYSLLEAPRVDYRQLPSGSLVMLSNGHVLTVDTQNRWRDYHTNLVADSVPLIPHVVLLREGAEEEAEEEDDEEEEANGIIIPDED